MLADILLGCLIQKRQMLLRQPHVIILKPSGNRRFPVRVLKNRELTLTNTFGHFSTTFLSNYTIIPPRHPFTTLCRMS